MAGRVCARARGRGEGGRREREREKEIGKQKGKMENEKKEKGVERKEREGEIRAGADRGDDRGAGRPRAHCNAGQTATHVGREEKGDGTMIEIGCRDREEFW